ncbi:ectonucleoside triphosphate diphosphohydrolase 1 [Octopus bimaculoides]|uniref:Ectonucleoside triphosphate diphosphohydrolase 1 n=1 Tax=Octopus bimaculoides TaxID=37653 RepID=A0A0L8GLU3_OCTBM|nr:ectonucleoside triphosphate diphosphohydrolase 1 [Octopus bimaculoides]XP_014779840.1 ectonucleoside triphosphate diphosphohydrolase 1 [Octopus bimaculoides]XP_014779841.1 ectonucleoside triphosphate diphosphohydrolase 1 [Octopus bimaculoides]|eukprot:XP_014779838.1 PREDICTED: ectonucleoside triphosphate diphosphohydrolase 1-like [Octopus bimaculoides]
MGCCGSNGHCKRWWYFVIVSFIIGAVGLITVSIIWQEGKSHIKYSLVFDAGSSHTEIFIFTWEGSKTNGTAVVRQTNHLRTKAKGIHHFSADPSLAGESMKPYLDFARKHVPESKTSTTAVYLGATAGMRILSMTNKSASDAILASIRDVFKSSKFLFVKPEHQVRILNGSEEGIFSWITANYLKGYLGLKFHSPIPYLLDKSAPLTYGALDMGGASTQIAFVPADDVKMPANNSLSFQLYGHPLTVYAHSYLCYGIDQTILRYKAHLVLNSSNHSIIHNPCWQNGSRRNESKTNLFQRPCTYVPPGMKVADSYEFVGTGEFEKCQKSVLGLFNFTACPFGNSCSFNKVYQPPIKDKNFYAFSTYYYTASFLNLTRNNDTFSLEEYNDAIEDWCELSWDEASIVPGLSISILREVCFEAVYIKTILTKGYHFDNSSWNSLHFTNKVANTSMGWTLGFMLYTSNEIPAETPSLAQTTFILLAILFILFIFLSIGFAVVAKRKTPTISMYNKAPDYGSTDVA